MFGNGKTSDVHHHWANRVKPEGRRSDGRVFYRGAKFFSYGAHYVAAYLLPAEHTAIKAGRGVVLYNTTKASPTTSGHVSAVRSASSQYTQIGVPDLTALVDYWPEDSARLAAYLDENEHARKAIVRHAERYVRELEPSAGIALYVLSGMTADKAERAFHAARAAARKADEKEKLDHARREHENNLRKAKRAAALTDREALAWAMDTGPYGREDSRALIDRMKSAGAELRRYQIAANKEKRGYVKTVQRLRDLQKLIKARREHMEINAARRELRLVALRSISAIRDALQTVDGINRTTFTEARNGAAFLAGFPRVPAPVRAKLESIRGKLDAALEMQARHDRREKLAKQAAAIAAWQAGESNVRPYGATDLEGGALLRAVGVVRDESGAITGGTLETSQGASVPLPHAIKAFRFVKLCRDAGRAWQRNGHSIRVGHYTLDSITPAGNFRAGCHLINWGQIERLARELGVLELPADDSALINTHAHA